MSTHNICFCGEIRENVSIFWLKIVPSLGLCIGLLSFSGLKKLGFILKLPFDSINLL